MRLDQRTFTGDRRGIDIGHHLHRMRIAHRNHRHQALRTGQGQRPEQVNTLRNRRQTRGVEGHSRGLEHRCAHVDRHPPVVFEARHDDAGLRAHADRARLGEALVTHEAHETARAVAALLDFGAVGVEDAINEIDIRTIGGLDQQQLVSAHTKVPIRQPAPLLSRQIDFLTHAVEHHKIVARALHLGELELHRLIIAQPPARAQSA